MKRKLEYHSPERQERDAAYRAEPPLGLSLRRLNHYGAFKRGKAQKKRNGRT